MNPEIGCANPAYPDQPESSRNLPCATEALRVSIVITNYNYGRYVEQAIRSALDQTHGDVEVIVVDDGSTDNSLQIIRRYPVQLVEQTNQGLAAARNNGAALASGDYLLFLDADDILTVTYVSRCLSALQSASANVAYAYTQMQIFGAENALYASRSFEPRALLEGNYIHASALMRKTVFIRVGGYDMTWRHALEDYELWVRMLANGYAGTFIREPLLRYRKHGTSRNSLNEREFNHLKWRIRGRHPKLYLTSCWKNPRKLMKLMMWVVIEKWSRRKTLRVTTWFQLS